MAEVVIKAGRIEVVSLISRTSAVNLKLKPGDTVKAVIKASELIVDKS